MKINQIYSKDGVWLIKLFGLGFVCINLNIRESMYQKISELLREVSFDFNESELRDCVIQYEKRNLIQGLIEHSNKIGFDLWVNVNKAIVASIAANGKISLVDAKNMLDSVYMNQELSLRETIFLDGIRQTDEFAMVVDLVGYAPLCDILG